MSTGIIHDNRWPAGVSVGGIGVGKLEVLPDGWISNVTINNNGEKPTGPLPGAFAAIWVKGEGAPITRMLRLKAKGEYEGVENMPHTAYLGLEPQATLTFPNSGLPVEVTQKTYSTLIPGDSKDSGLPVAYFDYAVRNTSKKPVTISLLQSWPEIVSGGADSHKVTSGSAPIPTMTYESDGLSGVRLPPLSDGERKSMDQNASGQYVLTVDHAAGVSIAQLDYESGLLELSIWSAFAATGALAETMHLDEPRHAVDKPAGALFTHFSLKSGETRTVHFQLTWYTPVSVSKRGNGYGKPYQNTFKSIDDIAEYAAAHRAEFAAQTREFTDLTWKSNLPLWLRFRIINSVFPLYANAAGSPVSMDQRTGAHVFRSTFFPDLDAAELQMFGDAQSKDGAISRSVGSIDAGASGDPNAAPSASGGPDITETWVMQVMAHYRLNGDRKWLDAQFPRIKKAMAYLASPVVDTDADYIPEGSTSFADGPKTKGTLNYTGNLYAGAIRAAQEAAIVEGDTKFAGEMRDLLPHVNEALLRQLWNGRYFRQDYDSHDGTVHDNLFEGMLAGDWLARASGYGWVTPMPYVDVATWHLVHDGNPLASSSPQYGVGMIGCQAIYDGYATEGIAALRKIADWSVNAQNMWHTSLSASGQGQYSMVNPIWYSVPRALSGASADINAHTLYLAPRVPAALARLHIPVFLSRFWGMLDVDPIRKTERLTVVKTFGAPCTFTKVVNDTPNGKWYILNVTVPWTAKPGAILDLSDVPNMLAGAVDRGAIQSKNASAGPTAPGPPPAVVVDIKSTRYMNLGAPAIIQEFVGGADRERVILHNQSKNPVSALVIVRGLPPGKYDVYRNNAAAVKATDAELARGITLTMPASAEKPVNALYHLWDYIQAAVKALPQGEYSVAMRLQELMREISEMEYDAKCLSSCLVRIQPAGASNYPAMFPPMTGLEVADGISDITGNYQRLLGTVLTADVEEVRTNLYPALFPLSVKSAAGSAIENLMRGTGGAGHLDVVVGLPPDLIPASVTMKLNLPSGWSAAKDTATGRVTPGGMTTFGFDVTPPAAATGGVTIPATVTVTTDAVKADNPIPSITFKETLQIPIGSDAVRRL